MTKQKTCPDCGSGRLAMIGPLPSVAYFAGRRLSEPLPGACLFRCRACDLRFRWPLLPDYPSLYDNSSVQAWHVESLRHDQRLVHDLLLSRAEVCKVLDFGCYCGSFLAQLPPPIERFGVEVSAAAAAEARTRAQATVAGTLEGLPVDLRFDAIVAMDVIEHVASPRALVEQLLSRLAPGGCLILTTGDGGNALWRLVGSRWWYCYFPEHIAFISFRWLRFHARSLGATVHHIERFNYFGHGAKAAAPGWSVWLKYLLRPRWHARKRDRHLQQQGTDMGVPGIGLTRDHLLVQLGR